MKPNPASDIIFKRLSGPSLRRALSDLASLRIDVFRDFPYLYEGTLDYEQKYLETFVNAPDAIIVAAIHNQKIIGCATGSALAGHHQEFAAPMVEAGYDISRVFYFGESVLHTDWRGRGIGHAFFDERESWAISCGFSAAAFCAVIRPETHPARPLNYSPLDVFWEKRGYRRLDGVTAAFDWRDVGEIYETTKPMQVWYRDLVVA